MSANRPDISFIVPVYNVERYLRECVDSILGQYGYDGTFEVILVEDGSGDSSPEICRDYAARYDNVRVLTPGHGGVSHARNCGIEAALGRYIAFVDSDDTILPHFAATMTEAIGDADIVCCRNFRRPKVRRPGHSPHVTACRYDAHTAVMWMLYQRNGIDCSPWGKLYRRDVIGDERFCVGRRYEDLEWAPRVMLRASRGVSFVDRAFYYYRDNPTSFINTADRSRLDVLEMVSRVERTVAVEGDERLERAAHERSFSAHYNMLLLMGADPEVERRCWLVIKRERWHTLFNSRTRLKSKVGAVMSLIGPRLLRHIYRRVRR